MAIKLKHIVISILVIISIGIVEISTVPISIYSNGESNGSTQLNTVSGFKVSSKTENSIFLTWNKVNNAEGYIIYRYDTTKRNWVRISKTKTKNNTYTVSNLASATEYRFAIKAYKTASNKEVLSVSYPKLSVSTLLNTVTGFKVSSKNSSSICLTWNKVNNAEGYIIYRYDSTKKTWVRISKNKTKSNTYTISNLTAATEYRFAIKAYKTVSNKEVLSFNYPKLEVNTLLKTVSGLQASAEQNRINLTWNKISNADGYVIYKYNTSAKKWERIKKTSTNISKHTIDNLKENTMYYFTVRAYKTLAGVETLSESFTKVSATTVLPSITNAKAAFAENMARVSWNSQNSNDEYELYIYDEQNLKWLLTAKTKQTNYIIRNLAVGKTYRIGIKSGQNNMNDMTIVKGTTIPGTVRFTTKQTDSSLNINWSKRSEADEYIIYTMLPGENWKRVGITSDLTYNLNNYDYDKYYVTVRACINYNGYLVGGDFIKTLIQKEKPNKTMYSDGDSIAFGAGSHGYSYATKYAEKHNIELTNKAVSGGTLSSGVSGYYHIAENVIKNANSSYDYILLEGGINDYYKSANLGKITPTGTTDFDINTTCGALESMLLHVKNNCNSSKVYFLSVHNISGTSKTNEVGLTYLDYKLAIENICKKYNVTIINCYQNIIDLSYTSKRNGICPNGDGIHPTEFGYNKYYLPIIESVIN